MKLNRACNSMLNDVLAISFRRSTIELSSAPDTIRFGGRLK